MSGLYLLLLLAVNLATFHYGSAIENLQPDNLEKAPPDVQLEPETNKLSMSEQPAAIADPSNSAEAKLSLSKDTLPNPSNKNIHIQSDWPFFPFFNPNIFYNPYFNQISATMFNSMVDQYKNDLDMIRHRQNLVSKYAECSSPNSDKCKKVTGPDGTEDLRAINYWNWGYNQPGVEYVTSDRFYAVMHSFKTAIEKLTLRQNMLYEYVECSCNTRTECGSSLKPVLEIMFANNPNTTGQLIQSLFAPGSSHNPASSFFQTLASFFSQIPSWFAYNFNPTTPGFGSPTATTPSTVPASSSGTSYVAGSPQTTEGTPSSGYWGGYSSGDKPVYSSSSSYSSTSGSGQQTSGGHVAVGGGGKPSQEQYFVSSNGGNVQVSSSTDGSGSKGRSRRYVYGPGYGGVNPGIAASQVGINAAQVGIQAAQVGMNAAHYGMAAGLYGAHVPYYL